METKEIVKHTPGPWSQYWSVDEGEYIVKRDGTSEVLAHLGKNSAANARLIAAAPELLEACRLMLIEHERLSIHMRAGDTPGMMLARKTIAKATKEESAR